MKKTLIAIAAFSIGSTPSIHGVEKLENLEAINLYSFSQNLPGNTSSSGDQTKPSTTWSEDKVLEFLHETIRGQTQSYTVNDAQCPDMSYLILAMNIYANNQDPECVHIKKTIENLWFENLGKINQFIAHEINTGQKREFWCTQSPTGQPRIINSLDLLLTVPGLELSKRNVNHLGALDLAMLIEHWCNFGVVCANQTSKQFGELFWNCYFGRNETNKTLKLNIDNYFKLRCTDVDKQKNDARKNRNRQKCHVVRYRGDHDFKLHREMMRSSYNKNKLKVVEELWEWVSKHKGKQDDPTTIARQALSFIKNFIGEPQWKWRVITPLWPTMTKAQDTLMNVWRHCVQELPVQEQWNMCQKLLKQPKSDPRPNIRRFNAAMLDHIFNHPDFTTVDRKNFLQLFHCHVMLSKTRLREDEYLNVIENCAHFVKKQLSSHNDWERSEGEELLFPLLQFMFWDYISTNAWNDLLNMIIQSPDMIKKIIDVTNKDDYFWNICYDAGEEKILNTDVSLESLREKSEDNERLSLLLDVHRAIIYLDYLTPTSQTFKNKTILRKMIQKYLSRLGPVIMPLTALDVMAYTVFHDKTKTEDDKTKTKYNKKSFDDVFQKELNRFARYVLDGPKKRDKKDNQQKNIQQIEESKEESKENESNKKKNEKMNNMPLKSRGSIRTVLSYLPSAYPCNFTIITNESLFNLLYGESLEDKVLAMVKRFCTEAPADTHEKRLEQLLTTYMKDRQNEGQAE